MSLFTKLLKKSIGDFFQKWKNLFIILVAVIIALVGLNTIANQFIDKVVGTLVREIVNKKSGGLYQAQFDKVAYIINDGKLYINNFTFAIAPGDSVDYDTLTQTYIYEASIPEIRLEIENYWSVFIKRELKISGIEVVSPSIYITTLNNDKKPKKIQFEAGNLYQILSGYLSELKISDFRITAGNFHYQTLQGADYNNFDVEGVTFEVRDFMVNELESTRKDKFFYTDDISLEISEQIFLLKDSMHQVAFDRFYLSTKNNELAFKNFSLTRRDLPGKISATLHDQYEISVPDLRMKGVDFINAYHNNKMEIDTIFISTPSISIHKTTENTNRNISRNSLVDLIMLYNDYLLIRQFKLDEAKFNYKDQSKEIPINYQIDHISAVVTQVELDTGNSTSHRYGFGFEQMDLLVKDYKMNLSDSVHTVNMGEFSISSSPFIIKIKDLSINPEYAKDTLNAKNLFYAQVPFLVISGLDLEKVINADSLAIKELYLENPQLHFVANGAFSSQGPTALGGMFGIYNLIRPSLETLDMKMLAVKNGSFQLDAKSSKVFKKISVDAFDLNLDNLHIDQNNLGDSSLLAGASLKLNVGQSMVKLDSSTLEMGSFWFSSFHKKISAQNILFIQHSTSKNTSISLEMDALVATGINLNDLLIKKIYELDTLHIASSHVTLNIKENADKTSDKPTGFSKISINHLIGMNNKLIVKSGHTSIVKVDTIDFGIEKFQFDQTIGKQPMDQIDFEALSFFTAKNYHHNFIKQKHTLEVAHFSWTGNDSLFIIDNFSLTPTGQPLDRFSAFIPDVRMEGIDIRELRNNRYLSGDLLQINQPTVKASLHKGKEAEIKSLDLGFLPQFFRGKMGGIKGSNIRINDANIKIHQKTDIDSLFIESDRINISAQDFAMDSTSELTAEKFLFASDVAISADYLSLFDRGKNDFYNVNHVMLSTKKGDIRCTGMYVATNINGNIPERDKYKCSVENLSVSMVDFYQLTQNKTLDIGELLVSGVDFHLNKGLQNTVVEQEPLDISALKDKPFIFDTLLLRNILVDRLILSEAKASYVNDNLESSNFNIPDIWVFSEGIDYNPLAAQGRGRLFYSDNIVAKFANLKYILSDKLNSIEVGEIAINSKDSSINAYNIAYTPLVSRYDYGLNKGYQSTWMNIENEMLAIRSVDLNSLLNGRLSARSLSIHKPEISVFRDKRNPFPEWQRRPLPQTMLRELDFELAIDTITMVDGFVTYQEHAEKAFTTGEVYFSDLNATIVNLTNDSLRILSRPHTDISATAQVFGKGHVKASFMFDLENPENIHTYGVEVDSLDLTEFNRIMIPSASVQITSGHNHKIIMSAKASEKYSYGEMRFYYNHLKIALLNRDTETTRGLGNVLGSFFANTFIIKSDNPNNLILRKGDAFFERDEKRAIFNYWTKTFLSGVVSSVGATNNKRKIQKMQQENLKSIALKKSD